MASRRRVRDVAPRVQPISLTPASSDQNANNPWARNSDELELVLLQLVPSVRDLGIAMLVCRGWYAALTQPRLWRKLDCWGVRKNKGMDGKGLQQLLLRAAPSGVLQLRLDGCRGIKELPINVTTLKLSISTLTSLSLRECGPLSPMSIASFITIATSLGAPLHTLDLSWCHYFGDGHVAKLRDPIRTLKVLRLRGTLVGDVGMEALFPLTPNLVVLDIAAYPYSRLRNVNIVSDRSLKAAKNLKSLQIFKVCGRRSVTGVGVADMLAAGLPLTRLDVRHCPNVCANDLVLLQHQYRHVTLPIDDGSQSESEIEICDEGDPVQAWFI
eukprot:c12164_g1_i1.p1 GENE.c12164_g1_i1~~c12164_g1_i1.p1  ORF type:complete len:327 (-),score=54.12 c12164_g1_i1:387-1367(-)